MEGGGVPQAAVLQVCSLDMQHRYVVKTCSKDREGEVPQASLRENTTLPQKRHVESQICTSHGYVVKTCGKDREGGVPQASLRENTTLPQ